MPFWSPLAAAQILSFAGVCDFPAVAGITGAAAPTACVACPALLPWPRTKHEGTW